MTKLDKFDFIDNETVKIWETKTWLIKLTSEKVVSLLKSVQDLFKKEDVDYFNKKMQE